MSSNISAKCAPGPPVIETASDPEENLRVANARLQELWSAMLYVVPIAEYIVRRIKADRPLPESPPEMRIQYDYLFAKRKECIEAFKVGLEPTSATNSFPRHGDLSPYAIYEAARTEPPEVVVNGSFLFRAVIELAGQVIDIGWNGQPGIETDRLHHVHIPSRDKLPAYRLCDERRWEELQVPFLMSRKIQNAFRSAMDRECSAAKAELRKRMSEAKITADKLTVPPTVEAIPPDPYAALRAFADTELVGIQSKIIKLLCDKGGRVSLADLAVVTGWNLPCIGSWNSARHELNDKPKLKKLGWKLSTLNSHAILSQLKSSAQK